MPRPRVERLVLTPTRSCSYSNQGTYTAQQHSTESFHHSVYRIIIVEIHHGTIHRHHGQVPQLWSESAHASVDED